ncbi:MAG TPA: hypothetical protein VFZ65_09100 [Planctomycetota bacterium]|nr:hypothetical protein [Planctomycetota bacterium]
MLRPLIPLAALLLFGAFAGAQDASPATKSGLRVLLVGQDPAAPKLPFADMAKERTLRLYRERTAAWEALLRYHFENVRVVHGEDYAIEMSNDADVTIFDCRPKALTPRVDEKDPRTGERIYKAATYLPESFDRPALMIAENSPLIGEPIGLKLDWL